MELDRRRFLHAALVLALVGPLGGCKKRIVPICPFGDEYSDPEAPLTIDVHAHIFNATDLQIEDFAKLVATRDMGGLGSVGRLLAGPLQKFAWSTAPTVQEEIDKLEKIRPYIAHCDEEETASRLLELRDQKYEQGKNEIEVAARAQMSALAISNRDLEAPVGTLSSQMMEFRRLTELPPSYDQLFRPDLSTPMGTPLPDASPEAVTFWSAIRFLIDMLQYRYVSIYNYLDIFNSTGGPKVDLIMPALVDYDWWLSKGRPTKSSLPDQMQLMKEIAILTGGRVHALVPFDPFRQAVFDMGQEAGYSPIDELEKAVIQGGAIGVKLYSPMGFAPYGNATVGDTNPEFWKRSWLAEVAESPDFGEKLDNAMTKLFAFCVEHDVPVMGHSNKSNGPLDEFEALTGPEYWSMAAEEFPDVRLSFGHFGGAGSQSHNGTAEVEGFLALMADDHASGAKRLAADASYFSNLIDDPNRLRDAMKFIYEYGGDDPPAPNRLMYGSDWKMLAAEAGAEDYLVDFAGVLDELEETLDIPGLGGDFFGANAADFFGLKKGQANRRRLEEFYTVAKLQQAPTWMTKVDRL